LLLANEIGDTAVIHRALDAAQPQPAVAGPENATARSDEN
jgi:hypothetical protein